jgi:hypothetical protein
MPSHPAVLTPPTRLPRVPTEAQLAHLVRVTPETLRAWRRRGEMPPFAVGPGVDEFVAGLKIRGRPRFVTVARTFRPGCGAGRMTVGQPTRMIGAIDHQVEGRTQGKL